MKTSTYRILLAAAGMMALGGAAFAQTTESSRESSRREAFQRERERMESPRTEGSRTESSRESGRDSGRESWRSDSSRNDSSRSESTRSDSSRGDSSRGDSSRGDSSRERTDFRTRDSSRSFDRSSFDRSRFGTTGSSGSSSGAPDAGMAEFAVITQNNIFLRNRRAYTPPPQSNPVGEMTPEQRRIQEESSYVLRGIAIQDNTYLGVIENTRTIETRKVQIGESIAQGKITEMTLDYLEYESSNGQRTRVTVGFNLAGGQSSSSIGAGGASSSSSLPASPEEASMIERMRARRAAEGRR